jgi:hypothetical protein
MNYLQLTGALVSAAGLVVFYYLMILSKASPQKRLGEPFKMLNVRLHYSPDIVYQTFEEAGEDGRPEIRRYLLYDFGLMACLTGAMIAVTANVADRGSWIFPLMIVLSVVRTVMNAIEDLLQLSLLRRYPQHGNAAARIAGVVVTLKHALLIAWVGLLFFLLILAAFHIGE